MDLIFLRIVNKGIRKLSLQVTQILPKVKKRPALTGRFHIRLKSLDSFCCNHRSFLFLNAG